MTDRKIFDLFFGAREDDHDLCRRAYETGADINVGFEGKRSTKGGAGRWYYGDLQWYAPDGIDGVKNDTLLIIAIKVGNAKLVEWILSLDSLDATRTNARGLDALAVAKATDREHFLLGMALPSPTTGGTAATTEATAGTEGADSLPRPSAGTNSDEEIARLGNAIKMFKAQNDQKETEIAKAKKDCAAYQQMLLEKDASIGELQKTVLNKEREVIVMMHKIGQLEEALRNYTDFRQADADHYVQWGQADYHNAEGGEARSSDSGK